MMAAEKTVTRMARLAAHQEETLAFQLQKIAGILKKEQGRRHGLERELELLVHRFIEESASQPGQNRQSLDLLFEGAQRIIRELERKDRRIESLKGEWDRQRTLWEESHRRTKALEILRDKLEREAKKEELRMEQKLSDNLTLIRRGRS